MALASSSKAQPCGCAVQQRRLCGDGAEPFSTAMRPARRSALAHEHVAMSAMRWHLLQALC